MPITIDKVSPEDQETFRAVMDLAPLMAAEMALVPVVPEKVAAKVYRCIEAGLCWVARSDGVVVGTIGLKELEFDYGDGSFWADSFFYVAEGQRFGVVGVKLLRAVQEAAREAERICIVARVKPEARKTEYGLYAEIAGFTPFGHFARIA